MCTPAGVVDMSTAAAAAEPTETGEKQDEEEKSDAIRDRYMTLNVVI